MTANKNLATDPTTDTLTTNYCYTTTAIVFTDNDTTIGSFVPCTTDQECYDPTTPQNTRCCVYESNTGDKNYISPPSYPIDDSKDLHTNLDLEEDVYSISSETHTQMAKLKQNCVFATVIAQMFMQAARLLLLNSPLVMILV